MVVSKQQQFPMTIHLLFSNSLNSQLVHKKGYFFIHGMVSIAVAKYNLTKLLHDLSSLMGMCKVCFCSKHKKHKIVCGVFPKLDDDEIDLKKNNKFVFFVDTIGFKV
jgi:hypothetical protein